MVKLPDPLDLDAYPPVVGIIEAGGGGLLVCPDDAEVEGYTVHGLHVAEVLAGTDRGRCLACGFGVRWPGRRHSMDVPWALWQVELGRIGLVHGGCAAGYLVAHPAAEVFPIGKPGNDLRTEHGLVLWTQLGETLDNASMIAQPAA